jgi:hypothetical protein
MTAIANPVPAKEIVYDRETRDYAMYLDGQCVGYARSYHEAETELDRIVYEQLRHTPSRNPNPNPSFEEEIEAPARASEIFNTCQIDWQGAIVLARAEEQSKNDAKALAIVEYVIKHYHEIRAVANGVMVPSDSQAGKFHLVSSSGCSCPARIERCKHVRAVALWRYSLGIA